MRYSRFNSIDPALNDRRGHSNDRRRIHFRIWFQSDPRLSIRGVVNRAGSVGASLLTSPKGERAFFAPRCSQSKKSFVLLQHPSGRKQYPMNKGYLATQRICPFPTKQLKNSKFPMRINNVSPAAAGTLLIAFALPLSAATLMGTRTTVGPSAPAFNLTTIGTSDWAYWETAANPATGTPTDEKSGATIVSSMIAIGGGNVRGSSRQQGPTPASLGRTARMWPMGSQTRATGLFNSDLDTNNRLE